MYWLSYTDFYRDPCLHSILIGGKSCRASVAPIILYTIQLVRTILGVLDYNHINLYNSSFRFIFHVPFPFDSPVLSGILGVWTIIAHMHTSSTKKRASSSSGPGFCLESYRSSIGLNRDYIEVI